MGVGLPVPAREPYQGIGAGLVAAFRRAGYAVVATSRSIRSSDESDLLTVQGDIAELETAQRAVEAGARSIRADRQPDQQRWQRSPSFEK